jgi:hypothetical protein
MHRSGTDLTVLLTHPARHAAQWRRINEGWISYAAELHICPSEWVHRRMQCGILLQRSFAPDANVRHHLAKSCLDFASLSYISTSWRWISAAHKCRVHKKAGNSSEFRTRHIFQVGHHVEVPHLCLFCVNASSHVTVKTRGLWRLRQHIWNLNELGLTYNRTWNSVPPSPYFGTMLKTIGNTILLF